MLPLLLLALLNTLLTSIDNLAFIICVIIIKTSVVMLIIMQSHWNCIGTQHHHRQSYHSHYYYMFRKLLLKCMMTTWRAYHQKATEYLQSASKTSIKFKYLKFFKRLKKKVSKRRLLVGSKVRKYSIITMIWLTWLLEILSKEKMQEIFTSIFSLVRR